MVCRNEVADERTRLRSRVDRRALLTVDATVNLALGVALAFFPRWLVAILGVPDVEPAFYPSILGSVLIGVGIALLLGRSKPTLELAGLGLEGAVAINLCGGVALAAWLLLGDLELPLRGEFFLWGLVILLVGLNSVEIAHYFSKRGGPS
jgi:hypothetical protein